MTRLLQFLLSRLLFVVVTFIVVTAALYGIIMLAPAVVLAARDVGGMVVLAAAFGFIGMGASTLWGDMLLSSREWVIDLSGNPLRYL